LTIADLEQQRDGVLEHAYFQQARAQAREAVNCPLSGWLCQPSSAQWCSWRTR
jgi:hypothetical protein